jgi:hypothetical protein
MVLVLALKVSEEEAISESAVELLPDPQPVAIFAHIPHNQLLQCASLGRTRP